MRSLLMSISILAAALSETALVACSKGGAAPPVANDAGPVADDAAAVTASPPDGGLAPNPPPAGGWERVDVSKADLEVSIPSGASVPADRAGRDAKFAGRFFRVVMPSGYGVLFAERHGGDATDVSAEKRAFRAKTQGKGVIVYEAPDAFVITRDDGVDAGGPHCETTACGKIGDRSICATATGARIDGTVFSSLTDTECLAVVTIARSIKAR